MPTRLGQNFLKDKSVVDKIIQSADLQPDDLVLEIGPGKGILTEELAKRAGKVITIEIDRNLIPLLQNKIAKQKNIEIINADVLKIDIKKIFSDYKLQPTNYKLIANIPYYITSKIIRLFLESENPPSELILMVQKEVAERIVSKPGKMSILAVSVQYYANAKILFDVPRENFDPTPEVDSAVIKVSCIKNNVSSIERKKFFRVVKAGFSAKRKTLINNLSNSLHLDKKEVEKKLKTVGFNPTVRAQELSVDDWKRLVSLF